MLRQTYKKHSYYDILKIAPNDASSDEIIREAYLILAKIYHPDKNPQKQKAAQLQFRLINEAYAALRTRESRERYNRILISQGNTTPKGLDLHGDNDNISQGKSGGILQALGKLFTPTSKANPISITKTASGISVKNTGKEHSHG